MTDIETRLTATFDELAALIPDRPASSFQEANARYAALPSGAVPGDFSIQDELRKITRPRWRRRPRSLTTVIVAGLVAAGGAGIGIAAAAGAFGPGPGVQHVFRQLTKSVGRGAPGAKSVVPITVPSSTSEHFLVTEPGPEGTTITVWSDSPTPGVNCFVSEVSEAGDPTFPGKPTQQDGGGCGATPSPSASRGATMLTGGGGSIWRSSSGTLYMIVSSAAVPGTVRVTVVFADGSAITPTVGNGWFAFGVPYNEWAGGLTQTEYSGSGAALYTLEQPPAGSH